VVVTLAEIGDPPGTGGAAPVVTEGAMFADLIEPHVPLAQPASEPAKIQGDPLLAEAKHDADVARPIGAGNGERSRR
jgi:hypothetical protein